MSRLSKNDALEFAQALRSASESKLGASQVVKLKKPLYKDYLMHVKMCARSSTPQPTHNLQKMGVEKPATSLVPSHYYCEKNQLLSLKQFIILMEESRRKTQRDSKVKRREEDKRMTSDWERTIQCSNPVNLRMTTSYVNKAKSRKNVIS